VLVRHGRTAWNADGRYQGHADVPLDETGRSQARDIARALEHVAFDCAVTSDLERARETAQIVVGPRKIVLERDARWRELNFGTWEGLTRGQIVARTPELQTTPAPPFVTPEGGESFARLRTRISSALDTVYERTPDGGRALVVTHAGPLHAVLRELLGDAEAAALGVVFVPASITKIRLDPDGATLLALNRSAR